MAIYTFFIRKSNCFKNRVESKGTSYITFRKTRFPLWCVVAVGFWILLSYARRGKENLTGLVRWPFVPESDLYEEVARINRMIHELMPFLTSLKWVDSVPQEEPDFDVQILKDRQGRQYAWITNWSFIEENIGIVELLEIGFTFNVSLSPWDSAIFDLQTGQPVKGKIW